MSEKFSWLAWSVSRSLWYQAELRCLKANESEVRWNFENILGPTYWPLIFQVCMESCQKLSLSNFPPTLRLIVQHFTGYINIKRGMCIMYTTYALLYWLAGKYNQVRVYRSMDFSHHILMTRLKWDAHEYHTSSASTLHQLALTQKISKSYNAVNPELNAFTSHVLRYLS